MKDSGRFILNVTDNTFNKVKMITIHVLCLYILTGLELCLCQVDFLFCRFIFHRVSQVFPPPVVTLIKFTWPLLSQVFTFITLIVGEFLLEILDCFFFRPPCTWLT